METIKLKAASAARPATPKGAKQSKPRGRPRGADVTYLALTRSWLQHRQPFPKDRFSQRTKESEELGSEYRLVYRAGDEYHFD